MHFNRGLASLTTLALLLPIPQVVVAAPDLDPIQALTRDVHDTHPQRSAALGSVGS